MFLLVSFWSSMFSLWANERLFNCSFIVSIASVLYAASGATAGGAATTGAAAAGGRGNI